MAFSPSGRTLYISGNYVITAIDPATGDIRWSRRYATSASHRLVAWSLAVSPVSGEVFVTGNVAGGATRQDYATVAYQG